MRSTAPTGLFIRAQLLQAVWGWLSRPVSMLLGWVERLQTSFELVRTTPNDDLLRTSFERSFGVLPYKCMGVR